MSNGATAGAAAAAAAMMKAVKASGVLVRIEPEDFRKLLDRQENPLVVASEAWVFGTQYRYLSPYRGLAFYAQSREPIHLPSRAEVIHSKKIWIPS